MAEKDRPESVPTSSSGPSGALARFSDWVDDNKRVISRCLYAAGFAGIGLALHSVRAFSRFSCASSVPGDLVRRSVVLSGRAKSFELVHKPGEKGFAVILGVDHRPLLPLLPSSLDRGGQLRLEVNSVEVDPSWPSAPVSKELRRAVQKGALLRFCLLKKLLIEGDKEALSCVVLEKKSFWKSENVGLRLVGRGLATVDRFDKSLENKKLYKKYYADLLKAEDEALKKGEGMWEDKQKVDERSGILQRIKSRIWG